MYMRFGRFFSGSHDAAVLYFERDADIGAAKHDYDQMNRKIPDAELQSLPRQTFPRCLPCARTLTRN
jgi:hypothetical protein